MKHWYETLVWNILALVLRPHSIWTCTEATKTIKHHQRWGKEPGRPRGVWNMYETLYETYEDRAYCLFALLISSLLSLSVLSGRMWGPRGVGGRKEATNRGSGWPEVRNSAEGTFTHGHPSLHWASLVCPPMPPLSKIKSKTKHKWGPPETHES